MSEFIEKRRELSIQEYEFMKLLKLFTDDEIRGIKQKRFQHEHKVERRTKELADFINYIVYENNLLELLKVRRSKLRVRNGRHNLESSIQSRVKLLYKRALDRFPGEYRIWDHYLRHCEKNEMLAEGSRTLDKMINFHGDKPKAWIRAARWEFDLVHSMDRAKHFMTRGLQRHADCRELYLSFLQLLVEQVAKLADEAEESVETLMEREDSLFCRTIKYVELIFEHYPKRDTDLEFYLEVINVVKQVPIVKTFGCTVLKDMKEKFHREEAMWNSLALLALEGSYLTEEDATSFPERLDRCIQIFKAATSELNSIKMWTFYIDAMLKLNEDMSSDQKLRRKSLGIAFKEAFEKGFLDEPKYIQYLKLLINTDRPQAPIVTTVLAKALEAYPSSTQLFRLHLTFLIKIDAPATDIDAVFHESLKACTEDPLSLWTARFQYYHSRTDLPDKLDQLFVEAIAQPSLISAHFQPLYLEYLAIGKGIKAARKAYREISKNSPPCRELHRKMIQLESIQTQPDVAQMRVCFENVAQFFGATDRDVWIEYVRFERDSGAPRNMQTIYERAKNQLDANQVAGFVGEYEALKNPQL